MQIATTLAGRRILVAEDDQLIGMFAESAVAELGGISAGCAQTCEAAIAMLDESAPDLILLDVSLGGRDSAPVLRAAISRNVPVLISSGSSLDTVPDLFRDFPILAKPWTSEDLAEAAQALFAGAASP